MILLYQDDSIIFTKIYMKIKVLGSGAWEGIPAPFCTCTICNNAKNNIISKNNRTRPQFLVTNSSGGFFIEASPDIRLQSTTFNSPEITNFFISHWHHDHIGGLRELHSWAKKTSQKPTIHCSIETEKKIKQELNYLPITINILKSFETFVLFGINITPLPVYHMFNEDENKPEESLQNTFAFLLESNEKSAVYLADYYKIPETTLKKIKNIDIAFIDGTYLLTEQYKDIKSNHLHGQNIIDFVEKINPKNVYYHSISHLLGKHHDELQNLLPSSHTITYDGMEI